MTTASAPPRDASEETPLDTGAEIAGPARPKKTLIWRVNKALTRELYTLYIVVSAVILIWPGITPPMAGTPAWRLLLELVAYEVLLVDVVCKKHLKMPRPFDPRNGFPSGHAAFSFALGCMVAYLHPGLAWPWLLMAGAISFSRMYLRAHYPYQVAGGAIAGALLALLVLWR